MKTLFLCFILLLNSHYSSIIKIDNQHLNKDPVKERKLMLPFGSHMLAPPHVSPPPPIFDSGLLPIQPVFNLIHFPHQYSSPLVNYAYPTIFNPYYNHLMPYGLGTQFANPHILSSMGMYGMNPHTQSMMQNGMLGMLPYANPMMPGMEHSGNSAQNYNQDRRLNSLDKNQLLKRQFMDRVGNQWQDAYNQLGLENSLERNQNFQQKVFSQFLNDMKNKKQMEEIRQKQNEQ